MVERSRHKRVNNRVTRSREREVIAIEHERRDALEGTGQRCAESGDNLLLLQPGGADRDQGILDEESTKEAMDFLGETETALMDGLPRK